MEHVPTTESQVEKIYKIASELGISLEDAAITLAGFELAFSDESLRKAIFGMIDQLDDEAFKNGEPLGLIISYAVELGIEGISVRRHANQTPSGQVVSLTPTNRAMIFVKIKDNFPTQKFLGPLILSRPEWVEKVALENQSGFTSNFNRPPSLDINELPCSDRRSTGQSSWPERGWQTDAFCRADGVVCSDSEMKKPAIPLGPSTLESARQPIYLGPIRLKLNERFPFISPSASRSKRRVAIRFLNRTNGTALNPHHPMPPLAALQAGTPVVQSASGLSPPMPSENLGHSERKMFRRHEQ